MNYPYLQAKKHIQTILEKTLSSNGFPSEVKLEIPPSSIADFAFPCFSLCKISKRSPKDTAQSIADKISPDTIIKKIDSHNGYINFSLHEHDIIDKTISLIIKQKSTYGKLPKKDKKVIVEHTSANPNGPLHVGRARNPIIGDTITRIFRAAGYECISQFYVDDLGKQVAILTWGIQHLKDNVVDSKSKSDHQMVIYYQKAHKLMQDYEEVAKEINDLVRKSEHQDQKTLEHIRQAFQPVLEGITESLSSINIQIDSFIPESKFVKDTSVDKVINALKKTSFANEENGAWYLDLKEFGIKGRNTKFFFTRSDGTSLYATRDIAYHSWKAKQADLLINILGEDHKLEAKQVEICLKLLKEETVPKPVFYAFVSLPGGKMSTRKARVVYLDDLIAECIDRAYLEVKKRRENDLSENQMKKIAQIIGTAAIRYNIIKVQPEKDIVFKWEDALNFEGNASPFIQYAHARAAGILSRKPDSTDLSIINKIESLAHPSEIALGKKLSIFPQVISDASEGFKPHIITNYLFETASLFNQFYRDCPVSNETNEQRQKERFLLVLAVKIVLSNGLDLLGIIAPDEM